MKHTLYIGALVLVLGAAACGQKGPLVTPPQAGEQAAAETARDNQSESAASVESPQQATTAESDFSSEESDD